MKRLTIFALAASMVLSLSGCVSQSEYDETVRSLAEAEKTGEELAGAKDELDALQLDYAALKADFDAKADEVTTLTQEKEDALKELTLAQEELTTVKSDLTAAQEEISSKETLLAEAQEQVSSLQESYDTLKEEYQTYRHQAEGNRIVIPDEIISKYEQQAQEAVTRTVAEVSQELEQKKAEALEAVQDLLVKSEDTRDPGTYDPTLLVKSDESKDPYTYDASYFLK